MKRTPLKKQSAKARKRAKTWAAVVKQRIAERNGHCEGCQLHQSICGRLQGHHKRKRRFADDSYENCMVLCGSCHSIVEGNPQWAYVYGYSIRGNSR